MDPGVRPRQLVALLTALAVLGLATSAVAGPGLGSPGEWHLGDIDTGISVSVPSMPSVSFAPGTNGTDRQTPRPGVSPLPTVPIDDRGDENRRGETTPDSSFDSLTGAS